MNRYTEIGEAVVTSSAISGKAKIHILQRHGLNNLAWVLILAALLGFALIFWLGRSKQPTDAGSNGAISRKSGQASDGLPASKIETIPHRTEQPTVADDSQAKLSAPVAVVPQKMDALNTKQQSDNALQKARLLAQQGKPNEALESYRAALLLTPVNEPARQAMVDLLLKVGRAADAERALQLGMKYNPKQSNYALQLAHLQVDKNEVALALDTLMKTLLHAGNNAEYQALIASLMQRQNRHPSAVVYYRKALALQPNNGEWLMGLGVSLKVQRHTDEAHDAFRKALETHKLSAQSQAFVEEQLKEPRATLPVVEQSPVNLPPAGQLPAGQPTANQ